MNKIFFGLLLALCWSVASAQDLPYRTILPAPDGYSMSNVTARMIDGLGYRYYWATEALDQESLAFGPEEGRTVYETLEHIQVLCSAMLSSLPQEFQLDTDEPENEETLRAQTLRTLQAISQNLRAMSDQELAKVTFNGLPLWNYYNGPLADAIYHTGQIVLMRRMAGNPIDPKVNVLMGRNNR